MNRLVLFLVFCVFTNGLEDGDECIDKNTKSNGVCKLISNCPRALADLKQRIYPTICSFQGFDQFVCCVEQSPGKPQRQPGEISTKMCKDYAQYVWTRELSPTLLVDADDIYKRECPFDRLQLVVGGTAASRREFPHMTQIGFRQNPITWACGGSLISDQFVLTAAHCIEDRNLGLSTYVRMGITDLDDTEHQQQYKIIERFTNTQYKIPATYHDIGLVKFEKKAKLNTYVRPACLYLSKSAPWTNVIATGWGNTEFEGEASTYLLRVVLSIYNETMCNRVYRRETGTNRLKEGIRDDLMICAGHSTELKDTCQGDSGGPLQVYKSSGGPNMTCMYDVIGVTSFGQPCGVAVNLPGVYTKVANYIQWIEDIVWPA